MKNLDRYLIIGLFAGYVGKLLISGASISDALVVLILAAANFLYNSQIQNKEITELKQTLTKITDSVEDMRRTHEDLKNAVAGVKISQGLRNVR